MDQRYARFKFCDSKLLPYLEKVMNRLPSEVKEDVLNAPALQILVDEDSLDACVRRYGFEPPAKKLIFLNPKILIESEHVIICILAHEIAHTMLAKAQPDPDEKAIEDLLIEWGFKKEVEAMRYDRTIARSEGYRAGYNWARRQSKDYLVQHFSLYFDEWNEKGLGSLSREQLESLQQSAEIGSILDHATRTGAMDFAEPGKDNARRSFSARQAFLTGILTAVKELKLDEFFGSKACETLASSAEDVRA